MKTKIRRPVKNMYHCPKCGALSYGHTGVKVGNEEVRKGNIGDLFCNSCGCNLHLASERIEAAMRKVNDTASLIRKEGAEAAEAKKSEVTVEAVKEEPLVVKEDLDVVGA